MNKFNEAERIEIHPTPESVFSMRYWAEYWSAIAQKTSQADRKVGAVCTGFELVLMSCLFDIPNMLLAEEAGRLPYEAYAVKVFFGTAVGVYGARTLQNWIEIRPRALKENILWERLRQKSISVSKRSGVSFIFGILMTAATQHGLHSLALTTPEGLMNWTYMLLNMLISNTIKDETMLWVDIRSKLRLNNGDFKIPIPNPFNGKPQKIVELQSLRILTGFFRYADLSLTGAVTPIALGIAGLFPETPSALIFGATFFASRAAYLSLTLVPMYFNLWYFKNLKLKAQKTLEADPTNDLNAVRLKKIALEVDALHDRLHHTVKFIKSLPMNILLSPVRFFKWLKGTPEAPKEQSLKEPQRMDSIDGGGTPCSEAFISP